MGYPTTPMHGLPYTCIHNVDMKCGFSSLLSRRTFSEAHLYRTILSVRDCHPLLTISSEGTLSPYFFVKVHYSPLIGRHHLHTGNGLHRTQSRLVFISLLFWVTLIEVSPFRFPVKRHNLPFLPYLDFGLLWVTTHLINSLFLLCPKYST